MQNESANLKQKVLSVTPSSFEELWKRVFHFQAKHNLLYAKYLKLLKIAPESVHQISDIPFLPISFFKTHIVHTSSFTADLHPVLFTSSGTTGSTTSKHQVSDLSFYQKNTRIGFEFFYKKNISEWCVLGLLPSYLERRGSSLIAMVDYFIQQSRYDESGFFLYDHAALAKRLKWCQLQEIPTLLIGVSFALLDFADSHPMDLSKIIIMETGGMKGRRKEITRTALHQQLQTAFNVSVIHSEYGMTELLSQAYSQRNGIFFPSPAMRVVARQITDPLSPQKTGKTGVLNIIDLANLDSCAFIATDDLGIVYDDGSFEVLGRLDDSDLRGCNLMVADREPPLK